MNEQHLYPKGNNFITDWEKYRKKHYFCDTFVINRKRQTEPLAVMAEGHPPSPTLKDIPSAWEIAGQARNDGIGSG